ncbi:disulfide reductase [bacterium]|nr:MAG: disulfide reductase [bacterium]
MAEKTGVFFCRCGSIITEKVDEDAVLTAVRDTGDVAITLQHNLLCSPDGKKWLAEQIRENNLDSVVVAACSPKQHEKTFMEVLENAGLNPFMLQMANIREQCAWMTTERESATKKAIAYIRAAIRRVRRHEPLGKKEIIANPNVLIIGAGIAGITAAQNFSRAGRKVYLVEKEPYIGGIVARFEEVYPSMECAPCMMAAMLQDVLQDKNIEVFTYSEVEKVKGFLGNFTAIIKKKAKSVTDACLGCGECFPVCPVSVPNKFDEGLSDRKAIYSPFAGALPNIPVIDREICLQFNNQDCSKCEEACPLMAIDFAQQDESVEVQVGGVVLATGSDIYDAKAIENLHYGEIPEIYTSMEFERLIASNGPTGGEITMKNGEKPKSIALIHCVGSRDPKYNDYCSGVCCLYNFKFARVISEKIPEAEIHSFYKDLCLPGKLGQNFADETLPKIGLVQFEEDIETAATGKGVKLTYKEKNGKKKKITVDMVVLSPAMVPSKDTDKLAGLFDIEIDERGFFAEDDQLLNPFTSSIEGIKVIGTAQGPKGINESVSQAAGAAGHLLSRLVPGQLLEIESKTTVIDEDLCGGCKVCISLCPYSAIDYDIEKAISVVNDVLCKGCGTCAAACPSGAAKAKHFTHEQIHAEIMEVI